MAEKDTFVHMGGVIEVDGKRYLPGDPFEMDLATARHNLRAGVRLLPASSVTKEHVAAVRANGTFQTDEPVNTDPLTANVVDSALNAVSVEETNEQADAAAKAEGSTKTTPKK